MVYDSITGAPKTPTHPEPDTMTTATIQAGAKLQLPTGQWATLKTEAFVKVLSERYGIYKVEMNGKRYSVDYKNVRIHYH